ncbi:MAG: tetratricopeptide repeat protein [bacterium]|nr:tetratricopeptide repeat protein [bacterium]
MHHLSRISLFLILSLLIQETLLGQKFVKDADKLALQYFERNEFEKANVYFEDLFERNPGAWYNYYYKSLLGAKEYGKAEKITKRLLKQNKSNVFLYVYLGKVYRLQGDVKKEKEFYTKSIKELEAVQPYLDNLTSVLKEEQLYDYAIEAYNKGRRATPLYPYFYERAELYKLKNDLVGMINEYLDALEFRESEIQTVQAQLQNSLGYDDEEGGIKNPLLKQELQKRIQKNPQKIILVEFLIFIQKQQKDFEGAFIQSKALDKRLQEDGQRLYELARICKSNSQWDIARRCYEYVIAKGPDHIYYDAAQIDVLEVEYLYLTQQPQPETAELLLLEKKLTAANQKYKQPPLNQQLLKDLASLKAYYLNKTDETIGLLEDYISQSGLEPGVKAEYKLMLGDIYLIKGEIWEASLLYSQVEKSFKYEAIGNDAKYRNAKLSYYAGDFAWAKTQADVLKGSTSKLIANDALELSLVITDAIGIDTNDLALKLFSSAELMILQHRYADAIARMDSINLLFSNNTLGDDIYYKKAHVYFSLHKYAEAAEMYKNIIEYYPNDLYGDDAQFKLAELYENELNDKEKAKQTYQEVLTKYPGSIYSVEARKRFRTLRGDNLNN